MVAEVRERTTPAALGDARLLNSADSGGRSWAVVEERIAMLDADARHRGAPLPLATPPPPPASEQVAAAVAFANTTDHHLNLQMQLELKTAWQRKRLAGAALQVTYSMKFTVCFSMQFVILGLFGTESAFVGQVAAGRTPQSPGFWKHHTRSELPDPKLGSSEHGTRDDGKMADSTNRPTSRIPTNRSRLGAEEVPPMLQVRARVIVSAT